MSGSCQDFNRVMSRSITLLHYKRTLIAVFVTLSPQGLPIITVHQ